MTGSDNSRYPVRLEEEDGGYGVTMPDIPYGATQGDDLAEALAQAEDFLEEAVLGMMAHDEETPLPSAAHGRPTCRSAGIDRR
jgi:antitoxin HicB